MQSPSISAVFAGLLAFTGVSPADAQESPLVAPFDAWVSSESVTIVPTAEKQWPSLGVVRYGDRVRVVGCLPDCVATRAWAMLEPFGAVRLSHLGQLPVPPEAEGFAPGLPMRFGRMRTNASAYERPDVTSRVVRRVGRDDELVFQVEESPASPDFLRRPDGSYIERSAVRDFEPSTFEGWRDPPDRFVFARNATTLTKEDGTSEPVARYARFPLLRMAAARMHVPEGTLPWRDVRIGRARPRPRGVPRDAKWVHLDLRQQVLTAYEGDRLVFATLVSSGRTPGTTRSGTFRVRRKLVYTTMKSESDPGDTYFVEGVQWVQYFHGPVAFHAAYWHDRFGTPMSHGCVNLAPADARYLFEFSPGAVPPGWRAVDPQGAYRQTLYVRVEQQPAN